MHKFLSSPINACSMQKVLELIAITKTKGLALSYMTKKKNPQKEQKY